jgi:hypothetical protein
LNGADVGHELATRALSGIILIVRRSNLPAPGSNGWSRNHDVKPAENDAASI